MISICIWENPNPEPQGGTITGGADQGQHRAIWKNKKRSGAQRTPTHDGRPGAAALLDRVTASNSAGIYPKGGKTRRRNCARAKIKKGSILESGQRVFLYRNHKQKGGHARPGKGRATANRQTETAIIRGIAARHNPYNSTGGQE